MQDIETQYYSQSGHIYISPPPPPPTLVEIYIYDPLDLMATLMLKGSFILLALAVFFDMVSGG